MSAQRPTNQCGDKGVTPSASEVYLSLHHRYLQEISDSAVQQLGQAPGAQARSKILQDFLAALYRHEDKLRLLQEAKVLRLPLQRMLSLVPVQQFLKEYLGYVDHSSAISLTCAALQPFSAKARDCPAFNYIVDKVLALADCEEGKRHLSLVAKLKTFTKIFAGPPPSVGGRLGVQFTSLIMKYISLINSKRYSVGLVECAPEVLPARVVEWLSDMYRNAMQSIDDRDIAIFVLRESVNILLQTQVDNNKAYFDDVVCRALEFYVTSLKQLHDAHGPRPPPPSTPSARSIFTAIGHFFPCEIFKPFVEDLLQPAGEVGELSQSLTKYLKTEISFVRVHDSPSQGNVVPLEYMAPLLDRMQGSDDCGVLRCLEALLRVLQREEELPEGIREQFTIVANQGMTRLRDLWLNETTKPLFLDETEQELRVTDFVRNLVALRFDWPSGNNPFQAAASVTPLPSVNLLKDICKRVYTEFVSYLQRLAERQGDVEKERMMMQRNLSLLNSKKGIRIQHHKHEFQ